MSFVGRPRGFKLQRCFDEYAMHGWWPRVSNLCQQIKLKKLKDPGCVSHAPCRQSRCVPFSEILWWDLVDVPLVLQHMELASWGHFRFQSVKLTRAIRIWRQEVILTKYR
jgi:hypothetical protein